MFLSAVLLRWFKYLDGENGLLDLFFVIAKEQRRTSFSLPSIQCNAYYFGGFI